MADVQRGLWDLQPAIVHAQPAHFQRPRQQGEVVGMLHQRFGDTVFDTVIPRTVKFPDTTSAGEPITSYAPTSAAAQSYRALAREVIAR